MSHGRDCDCLSCEGVRRSNPVLTRLAMADEGLEQLLAERCEREAVLSLAPSERPQPVGIEGPDRCV